MCPTAFILRERNKRVREERHTSQNQRTIYYQAKEQKEVNQGISWRNGDYEVTGEDSDILAVIPMTTMNEYVKCFQIGEIYYFGKKNSSRKTKERFLPDF